MTDQSPDNPLIRNHHRLALGKTTPYRRGGTPKESHMASRKRSTGGEEAASGSGAQLATKTKGEAAASGSGEQFDTEGQARGGRRKRAMGGMDGAPAMAPAGPVPPAARMAMANALRARMRGRGMPAQRAAAPVAMAPDLAQAVQGGAPVAQKRGGRSGGDDYLKDNKAIDAQATRAEVAEDDRGGESRYGAKRGARIKRDTGGSIVPRVDNYGLGVDRAFPEDEHPKSNLRDVPERDLKFPEFEQQVASLQSFAEGGAVQDRQAGGRYADSMHGHRQRNHADHGPRHVLPGFKDRCGGRAR